MKPRRETPFIGQMDSVINIYKEVDQNTASGEREKVLEFIGTIASYMNDKSGDLKQQDDQLLHVTRREYMIRYDASKWAFRRDMVLEHDGEKYRVYHAVVVDRRKFIKLNVTSYE